MTELLKDYLYVIKAMQDCGENLYSLNQRRIELHRKIVETLGISPLGGYLRLKLFTDNLDKVNNLYSGDEAWRLKTDSDVRWMAKYLERLLSSTEAMLYLEGKIQRVHGFNV